MSLQSGTRLGPYEIVGLLAAGGMGEVYRARDTRLARVVAIKVLPSTHAAMPDRVERFAREARAAAALNHQNILAVYDVGVAEHGPYLVSELLEGETLRERLVPGRPWQARQVLEAAVQIASGLAAAHARGIVHRDLKPENLFRCQDGTVKILDFGLARLVESSDVEVGETLTREHTVLGTRGYMAPEQVRGQPVDSRTDVFAFGAVLHELLTGNRAFTGESAADTFTAILTHDPPDLAALEAVPPLLGRIVMRCLEKKPEARFQSASDLAFALRSISLADAAGSDVRARRSHTRAGPSFGWGGLALGALVLTGVTVGVLATGMLEPSRRTVVPTAYRLTDLVGLEETPALGPDGRSVAFTASVGRERQVFVRLLAGGNPLQLTHAAPGCRFPRWSADSSSILCFSGPEQGEGQGSIWEVSALGGPMRRIAASLGEADVRRSDGRIVYFRRGDAEIELVTSGLDGSAPQIAARFPPDSYYWHPRWSPDGRSVAFQRGDGVRFDLFVIPAAGGQARQVTHDNVLISGLSWLPGGSLVYSSSRGSTMPYLPTFTLWEVGLDGGAPRQLTSQEVSYLAPDVDQAGRVAVARLALAVDIWRFPVEGTAAENVQRRQRVTRQTGHVQTPTAAPDGSAVGYLSDSGGHANIWIVSTEGGEPRQVTQERDPAVAVGLPLWSPDGGSIAFVSSRGNPGLGFGIWAISPDGGQLRQLAQHGLGAAWSADGQSVFYVERAGGALKKVPAGGGPAVTIRETGVRNVIAHDGATLYYLEERPLTGDAAEFVIRASTPEDGPSRTVAHVPAARAASWQIVNPSLSPDGRWLAQALTDGFTTNVWALPTGEGEWRQITDFGEQVTFIARRVSWSPDGRFIFAAVAEGDADIVLLDGVIRLR